MRKPLNKIMPSQEMGITELSRMANEAKKMKKAETFAKGIEMAKMKDEMPSIMAGFFSRGNKKKK